MRKIAYMTGVSPEGTARIARDLSNMGYTVYTADQKDSVQNAGELDLLVCGLEGDPVPEADGAPDEADPAALLAVYERYALGTVQTVHDFLPLLEKGGQKRIAFLTSRDGSNQLCRETDNSGKRMALSAVNMFASLLFNELRPKGYTVRMYCADGDYRYAAEYFTRDRSYEPEDPKHSDENRIVLRDAFACEMPW